MTRTMTTSPLYRTLLAAVVAVLLVPAGVALRALTSASQTSVPPLIIGVATAGNGSASIQVAQPAGATGVSSYTIEAVPIHGGTTVSLGGQAVTSPLSITGLTNGTVYQLRVTPVGGSGASASPLSNIVVPTTTPVTALDSTVTYVLPSWGGLLDGSATVSGGAEQVSFETMANRLRTEIGDGPKAKIGLSVFLSPPMATYTEDPATIEANLAGTMAQVQAAIDRAAANGNLPIGFSLITAIRERVDGVETAAALEDLRNVQWYHDWANPAAGNGLATGWMTYSQYARKMRTIKQAYVRTFGRLLKDKMRAHPGILVAVTGDGEIEMSSARFLAQNSPSNPGLRSWADYSPFAVLEFRDWLRGKGLYATGERLAADAFHLASRYSGDDAEALARFNADFNTSFTSWNLRYFNWGLSDGVTAGAVPGQGIGATVDGVNVCLAGYSGVSCETLNLSQAAGSSTFGHFDAPRPNSITVLSNTDKFWLAFRVFRDQMVHRYNRDFAQWITEGTVSSGAYSGGVPFDRFYSAQVPTDVLFGNPAADGGVRHLTSGSPYWTADIWPYGGMGVTGYNANANGQALWSGASGNSGGYYDRTVSNVAPLVVDRLTSQGRLPRW